jgi:hypothetical protein
VPAGLERGLVDLAAEQQRRAQQRAAEGHGDEVGGQHVLELSMRNALERAAVAHAAQCRTRRFPRPAPTKLGTRLAG